MTGPFTIKEENIPRLTGNVNDNSSKGLQRAVFFGLMKHSAHEEVILVSLRT